MMQANLNADFWVEVRHRHSLPKRYTWEIHRLLRTEHTMPGPR